MIRDRFSSLIYSLLIAFGGWGGVSAAPIEADRVVVLGSGLTELFFYLGHGDHVVGRTRYATYPEEARMVRDVGGMIDPDFETILGIDPDLILINHLAAVDENLDRLRSLDIPVRIAPMEDLDDLFSATLLIGQIAGELEAAMALVDAWKELVAEARADGNSVSKSILLTYDAEDLYAAGEGSFPGDLIETVGLRNVAAASTSAWPQLSKEAVLADIPDVVVIASSTAGTLRRNQQTLAAIEAGSHPFWKLVFEIRRPRFVLADPGLFVVNGPRTIDALAMLQDLSKPHQ